jgi:25S rRNA (cytosine2278-C5)-methyltransferase
LQAEKRTKPSLSRPQPRWVRINKLRSSLRKLEETVFSSYTVAADIEAVARGHPTDRLLYHDPHVPDVIAVPPDTNLTKSEAYSQGEIILQDKASCFPAQLLLENAGNDVGDVGDVLDGCAAPGNKTTHAAALLAQQALSKQAPSRQIFACERDPARSKTLQTMVSKAGAAAVQVLSRQDFLALDPTDDKFTKVTHLLLDPSCSGSGILGREDIPKLVLPADLRGQNNPKATQETSKKRKRNGPLSQIQSEAEDEQEQPVAETPVDSERLGKLADVQYRIVEHAMSFPAARRLTYSTCSVHCEENEDVVARLLRSGVAKCQGWKVLTRDLQPEGLRSWPHRGAYTASSKQDVGEPLNEEQLEGCIRCYPDDDEGTMGFFVVCFVRDAVHGGHVGREPGNSPIGDGRVDEPSEDEWEGFSDDEA